MEPLRYVFFGTPRFGRIILEELLHAGMTPIALVCSPDKPQGRKHIITPPLTKQLIHEQGLAQHVRILQPTKLADVHDDLAALNADVFVVAAYNKILRQNVLSMPPHGTVGVHPSLLPAYRGVAPIQGALLDDLHETGVALFVIDEGVDHGPVIATEKIAIASEDNYLSLEEKLARLGGQLVAKHLSEYVAGKIAPIEQDHDAATFTKKFSIEDGYVAWEDVERALGGETTQAKRIRNMIRALTPEPGVWTIRNNKRLKLLRASLSPTGALKLEAVQWEGRKPGVYQ